MDFDRKRKWNCLDYLAFDKSSNVPFEEDANVPVRREEASLHEIQDTEVSQEQLDSALGSRWPSHCLQTIFYIIILPKSWNTKG